jgi:NAD(P)-dependent dehydrogenase (short-subunit alcohol dehydrogenase family)
MDMKVQEQMAVMSPLAGRVAVVTGSTSGIGLGIARAFAEAGADLVINGLGDRQQIDAVLGELERISAIGRVVYNGANLMKPDEATRLVTDTVAQFGRIDILVNNAGIGTPCPAEDETPERFREVIAINLTSVFVMAQLAGRKMIEQGSGSIVNVASMLGLVASAPVKQASYCASKGGVVNLTRELAAQWARKGVRVNALAPGWFPSEMTAEMVVDDSSIAFVQRTAPMGRFGQEHELDGALLFLASDASTYCTGQILAIDGGWTAR